MIEGSWIRKMFDEGNILKQRYGGDNVFDLSIGNPVMEGSIAGFSKVAKMYNMG